MRLKTRIHEWLAEHVSWIQYPGVTLMPLHRRFHWNDLDGKEKAWAITLGIWALVIFLALYSGDRTN
jgi:hypothetical protein